MPRKDYLWPEVHDVSCYVLKLLADGLAHKHVVQVQLFHDPKQAVVWQVRDACAL